jgi:hypothetical protein
MLFMTVYTYKPANRDAVVKRRLEKGPQLPPDVKSVGEWSYTGGGRVFRLIEASDAAAAFKASYAWSDLGTIETFPVVDTETVMTMLGAK